MAIDGVVAHVECALGEPLWSLLRAAERIFMGLLEPLDLQDASQRARTGTLIPKKRGEMIFG